MDLLRVSDVTAYLDGLAGQFRNMSEKNNTLVNDVPTLFCDPAAFGEIAEQLIKCSKTIRTEMLVEKDVKSE